MGSREEGCEGTDIYAVATGVMGGVVLLLIGIIVYTITRMHGMRKAGEVKHTYPVIQLQKLKNFTRYFCIAA